MLIYPLSVRNRHGRFVPAEFSDKEALAHASALAARLAAENKNGRACPESSLHRTPPPPPPSSHFLLAFRARLRPLGPPSAEALTRPLMRRQFT